MPDEEPKNQDDKPGEPGLAEASDAPKPAASEAESPAPSPVAEADRFRPEAIAARVAGMGEETEVDRIAREEEEKLRERRKSKKGKRGLESAASKRLAKIGETKVRRPSAALADGMIPEADPLIERTVRARKWIEEHKGVFGVLVAVVVFGGTGLLGYTYWQGKREADASALLAQGIAAEHGSVSDKSPDDEQDDPDVRTSSLYPTFKSDAERRDAAIAKYRDVESKFPGTGAAILARLAEAGVLLDKGDPKDAATAYDDVKASALAKADTQVRGRALEGLGFAYEMEARTDAAGKDKHLDDALAAFKELEGVDTKGFKELGKYHEARVLQAKGDKDKAVQLLKEVYAAVTDPDDAHPFAYLGTVAEDRLRQIDPTALPPKPPARPMGAGPGGLDMNDPRIQDLIRQYTQQQKGGAGGMPGMPPAGMPGAPRMPPPGMPAPPVPAPRPPVPSP